MVLGQTDQACITLGEVRVRYPATTAADNANGVLDRPVLSLSDAEDAILKQFAVGAFGFDKPSNVGVAVSGGSDSMATLHLLAVVAGEAGWALSAVTVDHGLRQAAAEEAALVARACAKLNVPHETLHWATNSDNGKPAGSGAARAAYGLIADWARRREISHVALGHTADDQAETFLMNLARGSGIDGLAGMRHRWSDEGITWSRPFLLQDRADLREYLNRRGIGWVDDPSNEDTKFQRVKARKAPGGAGTSGHRRSGHIGGDGEPVVGSSGVGDADA